MVVMNNTPLLARGREKQRPVSLPPSFSMSSPDPSGYTFSFTHNGEKDRGEIERKRREKERLQPGHITLSNI